jgi:hypothetical protein
MEYRKYLEVKEYGEDGTEGMLKGHCHIFPELDGIHGSMWLHKNVLQVADEKEKISMYHADNTGASLFIVAFNSVRLIQFLQNHPNFRIYFIWLKPKVIDTYRKEALGRIYITDVVINEEHHTKKDGQIQVAHYIPYKTYFKYLKEAGLETLCVPCIYDDENISEKDIKFFANTDSYLIEREKDFGAGIVIKNYFYCNKHGKQVWMKLNSTTYKKKKEFYEKEYI